jgi:ATP-dependent RNA helicase DDX46/PRP5
LNQKLNYQKPEEETQVTEDAFKVFEEELEINDFPQNARWKVTSKVSVSRSKMHSLLSLSLSAGNPGAYL